MTELAEIEAALAQSFDDDHLTVYADALQALGDPRGELIAIELKGIPDELRLRHAQLHASIVAQLPRDCNATVSRGMIAASVQTERAATALLGSPHRRFVRSLELAGNHVVIRRGLELVAEGPPMPFLASLELAKSGFDDHTADARGLAAAAPALDVMTIGGDRVVRDIGHPRCRELHLFGDPIAGTSRWPALERLCWSFDEIAETVDPFRQLDLPRVATIELHASDDFELWELLARVKLPAHPHALVLPGPETDRALDVLREAQRTNRATTFRVPVRYRGAIAELPPGVEGPPPVPWPDPDTIEHGQFVQIDVVDDVREMLPLHELAQALDRAPLSPAALAAWSEFWELLDDIPPVGDDDGLDFPTTLLVEALRGTELADVWDSFKSIVLQLAGFGRLPEVVTIRQLLV